MELTKDDIRLSRYIVLRIDAAAMAHDGNQFWLSRNGVWLCDEIPWEFVTVEVDRV